MDWGELADAYRGKGGERPDDGEPSGGFVEQLDFEGGFGYGLATFLGVWAVMLVVATVEVVLVGNGPTGAGTTETILVLGTVMTYSSHVFAFPTGAVAVADAAQFPSLVRIIATGVVVYAGFVRYTGRTESWTTAFAGSVSATPGYLTGLVLSLLAMPALLGPIPGYGGTVTLNATTLQLLVVAGVLYPAVLGGFAVLPRD